MKQSEEQFVAGLKNLVEQAERKAADHYWYSGSALSISSLSSEQEKLIKAIKALIEQYAEDNK